MSEKSYRVKCNNKLLIGLLIIIVTTYAYVMSAFSVLGLEATHPAVPFIFVAVSVIGAIIASFEKVEKVEIRVIPPPPQEKEKT